ncbi:MAG TPA: amidohydrolase family protein [Armatimonadota bacterium]|nr:amidohydrolase family protein [Armatimonadota bacterium]
MPTYETDLYRRLKAHLDAVPAVDCHEHLQRESELPRGEDIHLGRVFIHYANCDLISAGLPRADYERVMDGKNGLSPRARWALLEPWYRKAWNTAYCEALRIAIRDLYGIEDFSADTVDALTDAMRAAIAPGFTRRVFDRAGIDFAMTNPFGPKLVFNPDFDPDCFIVDMVDNFTGTQCARLAEESGMRIACLDDYLLAIDRYFAQYGAIAGAFKVGRAYDRTLCWADVPRADAEHVFNRLLAFSDYPDRREVQAFEDFIMHYLCRKCGEYGIRMKFHTGLQEGNGNLITNSRAALLANLFMKYPRTGFDIYHISYPYQEELATLAKNFPNVTVDFCWMWIINPAAGRRALSDMLDTVPASKLHGFGGDFIFVEGSYGHAAIARREIARVLAEKVEEGRFGEEYAARVGTMLLRDNALENFGLAERRAAFRAIAGEAAGM